MMEEESGDRLSTGEDTPVRWGVMSAREEGVCRPELDIGGAGALRVISGDLGLVLLIDSNWCTTAGGDGAEA